jgi:hypothetical protein
MAKTTEKPRSRATPLEWRLYALTALAGVYLVSWVAIAGAPPKPKPKPQPAPPPPLALDVPAGWRVVGPGETVTSPPPSPARVVRAPTRHRARVRTRSS